MTTFEEAMQVAVKLPLDQRERLAQALGLKLAPRATLPMANATAGAMDAATWRARERGHAVLALDDETQGEITPGPAAIRGLWADLDLDTGPLDDNPVGQETVSALPHGSPVVVHVSAVIGLALDLPTVQSFWEQPPVEVRLATATYLQLLQMCATEREKAKIAAFVRPYAVLSLGPMASSRAAQIMLETPTTHGLSALDALTAATALAHEIPLVTRDARPFNEIEGLQIATLA